MKLQTITIFALYCTTHLYGQNHEQNRSISIIIDASTKSDLPQTNSLRQQTEQTSYQKNDMKVLQDCLSKEHELQAINSIQSSVLKKTTALCAIGAMAAASNPWIFPCYLAWRGGSYLFANQSIIDSATQEEAEKLAQQGKKRVSEFVFFPILYNVTRPSGQ